MAVYFLNNVAKVSTDKTTDLDIPTFAALRVLVVDDQPANRLLLTQQLEFLGLRPTPCGDGQAALQAWMSEPFDVVIMDCNMPNMNGYELARAMRQQEGLSGDLLCTLLGYTAHVTDQVRDRCKAAGMNDCLLKPIGLEALRTRLQQLRPTPALMRLQSLQALTGGDIGLTRRLLEEVRSNCAADRAQLWQESQHQTIIDLAHKIKGAARIVRADAVCRACDALEQVDASVDLTPLRIALCHALDDLHGQLDNALANL